MQKNHRIVSMNVVLITMLAFAASGFSSCLSTTGEITSSEFEITDDDGSRGSEEIVENTDRQPEIVLQFGHVGNVNGVASTPDGRFVLSASSGLKIWDAKTGHLLRNIDFPGTGISSFDIYPDGTRIAIGHRDGTITIRDLPSGEILQTLIGSDKYNKAVKISSDGRRMVGSFDKEVILWDLEQFTIIRRFDHESWVTCVDIDSQGDRIIAGTWETGISMWDANRGDRIHKYDGYKETYGKSIKTETVNFSPDGRSVLTVCYSHADVRDTSDFSVIRNFDFDEDIFMNRGAARFSPDGRKVALDGMHGDQVVFGLWDIATGALLSEIQSRSPKSRNDEIFRVSSFGISGYSLFLGTDEGNVHMFDTDTGELIRSFGEPSVYIKSIDVLPDNQRYLTTSWLKNLNTRVSLWDIKTGKVLETYILKVFVYGLEILPDGESFLAVYRDHMVKHRISDGKRLRVFNTTNPKSIELSPDGHLALVCCNSPVKGKPDWVELWDIESGKLLQKFEGHEKYILAASLSPDGRKMVSASRDGSVRLWDVSTGREIRRHDVGGWVKVAVWSPDGRDYYYRKGGDYHVIDAESGTERFSFNSSTNDVWYSSDNRIFVTSSSNNRGTRTWDGYSYQAFALTPNNRYLISGSVGNSCSLFSFPDLELLTTTIASENGESITWTPEMYFSGSERMAREKVCIVDDMKAYTVDQFFESFYRPDIVRAKIEGQDVSALVVERNLRDIIAPTPFLTIEYKGTDGRFTPIPDDTRNIDVVDGRVILKVTAEDQGGGAEEIRLFHNGVRASGTARGLAVVSNGDTITQSFTIQLTDGQNTLRALAFTSSRIESTPRVIAINYNAPVKIEPTLWVLAVGINEYKNGRYNLNYAVNDADSFIGAVKKSGKSLFKSIETTLLTDKKATRQGITDALEKITARAKPEDVFMFFYAGHGIALESAETERTEFFFIPTDVTQMTDMAKVMDLGLAGPEFEILVSSIPARKQFLVLDACNSGAINSAFGVRGAAEEIALSRLSRATGSALIAASRDDQFAQEFAALGQGALTKALLDGLGGNAALSNGQITVGSLKGYVESALPGLTEQYAGRAQYPTGFVFGQDFPIGVK